MKVTGYALLIAAALLLGKVTGALANSNPSGPIPDGRYIVMDCVLDKVTAIVHCTIRSGQ